MKLIKLSAPGWEKDFVNEADCKAELYKHICNLCRAGTEFEEYPEAPVDENSTIDAMLSTACGCEYMIEE